MIYRKNAERTYLAFPGMTDTSRTIPRVSHIPHVPHIFREGKTVRFYVAFEKKCGEDSHVKEITIEQISKTKGEVYYIVKSGWNLWKPLGDLIITSRVFPSFKKAIGYAEKQGIELGAEEEHQIDGATVEDSVMDALNKE